MLIASLAMVLTSTSLLAQDARDFSAGSARVTRAPGGAALTGPSNAARPDIVASFLNARHDARTVQSLVLLREHAAPTGVTHLTFGQRIAGLDVYGTYARAALTARGEIVNVAENLAAVPAALVPATVTPRGALDAVLAEHYPGAAGSLEELRASGETVVFGRGGRFTAEPTVTRIAVPMANGALHTGYLVVTWDTDNMLRHSVIGQGGRLLVDELRTNSDKYNVFADHPGNSPQVLVDGPGTGNAWSPLGWLSSTTTIGNNVDAYLDRDDNDAPDANGRPVSSTQEFNYTVDLALSPTTTTNQMAAVTNLFYLNNVIHDKLYRHGFTESAGNFQTNNFGNGGLGNDAVLAEAQDGGGTSNANFATPADGSKPRMQMYLWSQSTPNRDGDLDSDIVWHEYGHGLTWRMIGSMTGPFAGAIGEGMSDTLALYVNRNDTIGEYSYNNTNGIRRYPYTGYPLTYGDLTGSSVHSDGEIYAATMWKLLDLWEASGKTQDALFDRVIDGMNYTPARPAYEDMRNGILDAMPTQEEDCLVWRAFAQFGIGQGADGVETCKVVTCRISVTESFAVPSVCAPGGGTSITLAATGVKVKGVPQAKLSWSGATGSEVNIFRDGALLTTTANDGLHTDTTLPKAAGSYTYRVCATDGICSPDRTIVF
jgi:hypothetical protein